MWKSGCCLLIAIVLAVVGLCLDVLLKQSGDPEHHDLVKSVKVEYGFEELRFTIETTTKEFRNITENVQYETAYKNFCGNDTNSNNLKSTNDDFCNDLNNLKNAGLYYMVFNVTATFLIFVSFVIAILVTLGQCLCKCRCKLRWFMAALCLLGISCYVFAFGFFLIDYNSSLNDLLTALMDQVLDNKVEISWNPATIGSSIACLFGATGAGIVAFGVILYVDRNYIRQRQREPAYQRWHE